MKLLSVPFSLAFFLTVCGPARGQDSSVLRDELQRDLAEFRGNRLTSVASAGLGQNDLRRDLTDFRPTVNPAAGTQPNFQGFDPAQLRQRLDDLRSNFAPSQTGQNFDPSQFGRFNTNRPQFRDRDGDRWDGWHHDHDYDRDHDHDGWRYGHGDDRYGWHHGDHHDWDHRHHGWNDDHAWRHDHDWDHRHHDDHQWAHHDWRRDGDRDHHDWRRDHDRSKWARHDDRWQHGDGDWRHDNGKHTGWDPDHHKASWQDNGWRARGFTSPPGQQRGSVTSSNFTDSKPHSSGNRPSWSGGGSRKGSGGGKSKGK